VVCPDLQGANRSGRLETACETLALRSGALDAGTNEAG